MYFCQKSVFSEIIAVGQIEICIGFLKWLVITTEVNCLCTLKGLGLGLGRVWGWRDRVLPIL